MKVEMINKGLRPCVQNGNKSDLSFKSPLGVFSKCLQGFIDSTKQKLQAEPFVA